MKWNNDCLHADTCLNIKSWFCCIKSLLFTYIYYFYKWNNYCSRNYILLRSRHDPVAFSAWSTVSLRGRWPMRRHTFNVLSIFINSVHDYQTKGQTTKSAQYECLITRRFSRFFKKPFPTFLLCCFCSFAVTLFEQLHHFISLS